MQNESKGELTDRFGAVASSLCALHCAICGMAPALFGVLGLGVLLSHEVELGLALMAILVALWAIVVAWRQHRSKLVLGIFILGIAGLVLSRGLEMGGHDGHHEEEHHAEAGASVEGDDGHTEKQQAENHEGEREGEHGDEHEGEHGDEHEGDSHALGAAAGVLGGGLLFAGHLLNLRAMRRRREDANS